jgi:myo-inositol 2-dehydrogenase / D-chiro-inositol 1-dehydrogenase
MTLGIGVIGTGNIGRDHIRRITDVLAGGRVVAVTDVDRARAEAAAEKPGARVCDDAAALVAAPEVEAVMVCSWGAAHEEAVLPALAAGKPVFCEKPLATTQGACLRIIEAEARVGRRMLQLVFMRRYDADYLAMKAVLDSGEIGEPLLLHSVHRNPGVADYFVPDTAITDTMVHDIDIARWLFGDEVARVRVFPGRRKHAGAELRDPFLAVLEMAGGALASVEVSVSIGFGYDIRGEVSGERGTVALAETHRVTVKSGGRVSGRVPDDWRERFARAYDVEIAAWIRAAAEGGATGPGAWDGYAAAVVCDAALEAARTGEGVEVRLADRVALYG